MTIVYAAAASHAPGICAWSDKAPPEQLAALSRGFDEIRDGLEAADPDVILLLTSEHWANFFLDHIGAFCIGRGDSFEGPLEPWLKVAKARIPGDPALAARVLEHCYANGFELSYLHEMKLDHGTMVPLSFLTPKMNRKLVPLMFNTLATPRPSAARCLALGRVLAPMLEAAPERIAIIATGGLSHDPGEINHGRIDGDFDRLFLDRITSGRVDELGAYSDKELLAAGAGTLELLAWICLAGVMGTQKPHLVAYEAVEPWATGMGLISYEDVA
ncbi:MAG: 2,3-dihydroxyphenylpropionate 1,2-dioxygenase [Hyphomicrobiales bacterium]|nr:2,3-dihydroxyphenylpropionate 1,2-dioxygenase [Hyphomicrobiales bacterium]